MIDFNRFLKMNPLTLMKKIIGFEEIYTIAYRNRDGHTLLDSDLLKFEAMPYSNTFWYADPILVSYRGESYLLLESYDMRTKLGSIAYARFDAAGKLSAPEIIIQEVEETKRYWIYFAEIVLSRTRVALVSPVPRTGAASPALFQVAPSSET